MQANAPATKPVSPEVEARIERERRKRVEMLEYSQRLAEGARFVNRPGDDAKCRFIDTFIGSHAIEGFPFIEPDMAEEAKVEWSYALDPNQTGIHYVALTEVEKAFRLAGADPPLILFHLVKSILRSDVGLNLGSLEDVPVSEISPELVLAHITALGLGWPKRVAFAAARRLTVVLLNRHRFEITDWKYDEKDDEWETTR
jgi:hypothetical protein